MTEDVLEGTATDVANPSQGGELVPTGPAPATLFHTADPVQVVERASKVAGALKDVLKSQKLTAGIGGREHVLVEGWTTLGSMVGVTPVPVWTKPVDGQAGEGRVFGWEARVEARTLDGRVIGAAEAMCTRAEKTWKSRDDYALRSMAQTRAISKALRGPLGFVVTLAGYEATPAEEMPAATAAAPVAEMPAAASAKLLNSAGEALTYLHDNQTAAGAEALVKITQHFDGVLTVDVAQTIVLVAKAVKEFSANDLPWTGEL